MAELDAKQYLRSAQVAFAAKEDTNNGENLPEKALLINTRIKFVVEKTTESEANKAKISLYNLSELTKNFLQKNEVVAFLNAGYEGGLGTIFIGDIQRHTIKREGPDVILTLEAGDFEDTLRESHTEISLGPGGLLTQLITIVKDKFKKTPVVEKGIIEKQFQNGFSFSGATKDLMDFVAKTSGIEWSMQDGQMMITPIDGTDDLDPVVVGPNTGLIGTPTRTEKGFQFTALLNPRIRPNRKIIVVSKQFQGLLAQLSLIANIRNIGLPGADKGFGANALKTTGLLLKAQKVIYTGDTREGKWTAKVEGIQVEADSNGTA